MLKLDQAVVGLDNFATGYQHNLDEVQSLVTEAQWARLRFIEGDIVSLADCERACAGVEYVLHQAALGSVPRSINDPITTNAANVSGFLNRLVAARGVPAQAYSDAIKAVGWTYSCWVLAQTATLALMSREPVFPVAPMWFSSLSKRVLITAVFLLRNTKCLLMQSLWVFRISWKPRKSF